MIKNIFLFVVVLFPAFANAATGFVKGKVQYIRVHDTEVHTSVWSPPSFWFTLEASGSAGDCGKWNGNIGFAMDTEQAYSMVLGAFMAGKEIAVRYDDSLRISENNGWCKATNVTIGDPPPLQ